MNNGQRHPLPPLTPRNAFERAAAHLKRADDLAAKSDYPMAFAILILGIEEWAKALLLEAGSYDLVQWGKPDEVDPFRLDPKTITSHVDKQTTAVMVATMTLPMRGRVAVLARAEAERRVPTPNEFAQQFKKDVRAMHWLVRRFRDFEGMKEAAFYSGNRTAGGKPAKVATKAQFERLRPILAEHLIIDQWGLEHPPTREAVAELRRRTEEEKVRYREFAVEGIRRRTEARKHRTK